MGAAAIDAATREQQFHAQLPKMYSQFHAHIEFSLVVVIVILGTMQWPPEFPGPRVLAASNTLRWMIASIVLPEVTSRS